jgi:hypothetical protein
MKDVKTARFNLKSWERIGEGHHVNAEYDIKFQHHPFSVYIYCYEPNKGAEILYKDGLNKNQALVKPNGFPWLNLNLDPAGALIRDNSHHTISEMGFAYMYGIINNAVKMSKVQKKFNKIFSMAPPHFWSQYDCVTIKIEFPDYAFIPYKVKANETIIDIARKNFLSELKILKINKLKSYTNIEAGQEILIPNGYAKTTVLFIDLKTHLPVYQEIYDDLGKFEAYEYHKLIVNEEISEDEFSSKYHAYGF